LKAMNLNTLRTVALMLLLGGMLAGCGKPDPAPAPPAPKAGATAMPSLDTSPATPPPPGTTQPAAAVPSATAEIPTYEGKDEAAKLTQALQDYYTRNGATAPAVTSLDALVKAGLIKSVPAPPAGKKYVIDPATVSVRLENQ